MADLIILTGMAHSYTSAVSKFLLQNGCRSGELTTNKVYGYLKYEDEFIYHYMKDRRNFKKPNIEKINEYVGKFDRFKEPLVFKLPYAAFFWQDFRHTNRKLKIIGLIRNPLEVIQSTLEKSPKRDPYSLLGKWCTYYKNLVSISEIPVIIFPAERLWNDGGKLLQFCGLFPQYVDYGGIDPRKIKSVRESYLKFRFKNFWRKLL